MKSLKTIQLWIEKSQPLISLLIKLINWALLFSAIVVFLVMVYDFGFEDKAREKLIFKDIYIKYTLFYLLAGAIRFLLSFIQTNIFKTKYFELIMLVAFLCAFELLTQKWELGFPILLIEHFSFYIFPVYSITLFHALAVKANKLYQLDINPSTFFVLSFFILIGIGTIGLLLPNSTVNSIKYIDALFISVSAVCTTGLSTLDISKDFTTFGHSIIMILVQLGGLGVMTFAGLLAKMFASGSSFQQQKILQSSFHPQTSINQIITGDKLSEVMNTIYKIIFITILIEAIGAILIYFSTWGYTFQNEWHRLFFALFHSISAFCNAGLTLPTDGMLHADIATNYSFQTIIAVLYIMGGIGFPIVFVFYKQFKNLLVNIFRKTFYGKHFTYTPHLFVINAKVVLSASIILTLTSIILISAFEWNNSLAGRPLIGKIVGVFFSATTPSYAGINLVDMSTITYPVAILSMLLMWIGASPESTGGGIKTTTFSLALLNLYNTALGKDKVVIFGARIGQATIRRSYAVISVSVVLMALFIFLVYAFDGHLELLNISFEVFSAFNNNGLSLGITSNLSFESKAILCFAMFAGRVGTLSLLSVFLYKKQISTHKYPSQEIIF